MTFKETLKFILELVRDTFKSGGLYRDEMQNLEISLGTRAWLMYFIQSLVRVFYSSLGIANHQS